MADLVRVEPVALMPTQAGCAVFLGDGGKVIVFFIDPGVGASINAALSGQTPARPLTHDLFASVIVGMGGTLRRVMITKVVENTYYAELIIARDNE